MLTIVKASVIATTAIALSLPAFMANLDILEDNKNAIQVVKEANKAQELLDIANNYDSKNFITNNIQVMNKTNKNLTEFIVKDGTLKKNEIIAIAMYDEAMKQYIFNNPLATNPTCTDLETTKKINVEQCEAIKNKDLNLYSIANGGIIYKIENKNVSKRINIKANGSNMSNVKIGDEEKIAYKSYKNEKNNNEKVKNYNFKINKIVKKLIENNRYDEAMNYVDYQSSFSPQIAKEKTSLVLSQATANIENMSSKQKDNLIKNSIKTIMKTSNNILDDNKISQKSNDESKLKNFMTISNTNINENDINEIVEEATSEKIDSLALQNINEVETNFKNIANSFIH